MSFQSASKHTSKTLMDHEILDAPPAYTPTADYIPSPPPQQVYAPPTQQQQQVYAPPPMNPNYLSNTASYQQPQVDYQDRKNRKMSTFQYNFNRGIIGNAFDFASHSVSGATSRASAKSTNDATKAVLDSVSGFLEKRLTNKDQKELEREMKYERRQEFKEARRESKRERRQCKHERRAHGCCSHRRDSCNCPELPQPHAPYGGSSSSSSCKW